MVQVMVGVRVVEAFAEPVKEDAGVWVLKFNLRVGAVVVIDGKEDAADGIYGLGEFPWRSLLSVCGRVEEVVTNHRMDLGPAEESALSLEGAEQEESCRDSDCSVDAVLDRRKDSDKNTSEEDRNLDRGYPPELVDRVWWKNQVAYSVNDNCCQCGIRNIPEHGWKCVDGE
jgi:hypothetical protein